MTQSSNQDTHELVAKIYASDGKDGWVIANGEGISAGPKTLQAINSAKAEAVEESIKRGFYAGQANAGVELEDCHKNWKKWTTPPNRCDVEYMAPRCAKRVKRLQTLISQATAQAERELAEWVLYKFSIRSEDQYPQVETDLKRHLSALKDSDDQVTAILEKHTPNNKEDSEGVE